MKKVLKIILGLVFLPPLIYGLAHLIGILIPVNTDTASENQEIEIYIQQFGAHTDLVLPLNNEVKNWEEVVDPRHSTSGSPNTRYVSFGWGDLGFYRDVPTWDDLTLKIAVTALFTKSPSAVHLKYSENLPQAEKTVSLKLTKDQYKKLCTYIENTFKTDEKGKVQQIPDLYYTQTDAFYKARGSLSLFKTCNTWINNALKAAGIRTSLWTALPQGIFYQYD